MSANLMCRACEFDGWGSVGEADVVIFDVSGMNLPDYPLCFYHANRRGYVSIDGIPLCENIEFINKELQREGQQAMEDKFDD